jgi:Flp pilus assembly protein TadG
MNAGVPIRKFRPPMGEVMFRVSMRRFSRDRRGNVAIIFALSMIPCVFLVGMALDFTSAAQKRVQLYAAADAAALAAVTPSMMTQSTANANTAATNAFNAVASNMTGVTSVTPTITVTSSNGGLTRTRQRDLHRELDQRLPQRLEAAHRHQPDQLGDLRIVDVDLGNVAEHRLLPTARQFAVD